MRLPVSWAAKRGLKGPWPCEACHEISQYADVKRGINRIFCRNPVCGFTRIIDKRSHRTVENDGTCWEYFGDGSKRQVTCR